MEENIKEIEIQVSINHDINEASFILAPKSAQNMNEIYAAHLEEKIGSEIKRYKEDVECALDIVRNSEKMINEFEATIEESKSRSETAEEKVAEIENSLTNYAKNSLENITEEAKEKFDSKVNKAGDTMTGNLKITRNSTPVLEQQNASDDRDVAPSTSAGTNYIRLTDKNNNVIAQFANERTTDGKNTAKLQAFGRGGSNAPAIRVHAYADGRQGCSFPMCTTKPTTTSSARNDLVAAVVQNYLNGSSWYRVWSDGFIEQGGAIKNANTPISITFAKTFTDANSVRVLFDVVNTGNAQAYCLNEIPTVSGFKIFRYGGSMTTPYVNWFACGY